MTDSLDALLTSQSRYLSAAAWATASSFSARERLARAEHGSIATLCIALGTGVRRRELCAEYVAALQAYLADPSA